MAPKAALASIATPNAGTATASEDSVSPSAPPSVQGRQQRFMQALEEASTELTASPGGDEVFPYGIAVPFKVRDAVPGNKMASAKVFLAEAPLQALKDMCFYLELVETGKIDDLSARILDYFEQLFPIASKGSMSSTNQVRKTVASGPTPARARTQSTGATAAKGGTKRLQETEAERSKENEPDAGNKKRKISKPTEPQADVKKTSEKTAEKMQKQYCVAGLSIAAQMKLALKMSMEG